MKEYHYWPNNRRNKAVAIVKGGPLAPNIRGTVTFEDVPGGTKVCAAVYGLPLYQPAQDGQLPIGPHGFHLHENGSCAIGDPNSPYQADDFQSQPSGNSGRRLACGVVQYARGY